MFSDVPLECRNDDFFVPRNHFCNYIEGTSNSLDITQCRCKNTPCILIHGAAENFDDALIIEKVISCKKAASAGYQSLLSGASPVEAVEAALWWLECDEFFNCGYGSLLNEIGIKKNMIMSTRITEIVLYDVLYIPCVGDVQMDASIIDGFKEVCGSIAAVSNVEHPISLARYVLDNFPNSIVVGEGAKRFAEYAKLNWLSKENMVAPMAYLAYKLGETCSCGTNWDIEDHAELLKSNCKCDILRNRFINMRVLF